MAFAPSTPDGGLQHYFEVIASRINAAGWRPEGNFPSGIDMTGVDLSGSVVPLRAQSADKGVVLRYARLEKTDIDLANLGNSDLSFTAASGLRCVMSGIYETDFSGAELHSAQFMGAVIDSSSFRDSDVSKAQFKYAQFENVKLDELAGADLIDAIDRTKALEPSLPESRPPGNSGHDDDSRQDLIHTCGSAGSVATFGVGREDPEEE